MAKANGATTARVVHAASQLFAERGFHRTTMRDIAARARVNLAAANYHFGSKRALYLEVLREQFAQLRSSLAKRGAAATPAELARLSREQLIELFRARCEVMLETMIGPPPSVHADLMVREMAEPSEALPVIVDELIDPMRQEMAAILARLAPELEADEVERCLFSIVGQILFYRFLMPAVLRMMGWQRYPQRYSETLANHVTGFSLGGMAGIGAGRVRSRRAR